MEAEPDAWIPARSAGWGAEGGSAAAASRARFEGDPVQQPLPDVPTPLDSSGYPLVAGRLAYLDVPDGSVAVAALVKVGEAENRWELQTVGVGEYELLGALRVQVAKLERRLADRD